MTSKYYIPPAYRKGFDQLMSLSQKEIALVVKKIQQFSPGHGPKDFIKSLSDLDISGIEDIAETIYSFGSILISQKPPTPNELAEGLVVAYIENNSSEKKSQSELVERLQLILNNSENIKMSNKGLELILDVENAYRRSTILTDIRPVFKEDLNDNNRFAIISQQLKIIYSTQGEENIIFINLDNLDLEELKSQIERAQKKELIIRNDYSKVFTFLKVND